MESAPTYWVVETRKHLLLRLAQTPERGESEFRRRVFHTVSQKPRDEKERR